LIPFTKAHACGNDFLIVTEDAAADHDKVNLTRRLCARTTGIGADGIEFFRWTGPESGRIRLHNADGSVAEISGNGTRCVAAWMAETLDSQPGEVLEISTDAGVRFCRLDSRHGQTIEVTSGMGVPAFEPKTLTVLDALEVHGMVVSTGNPHFVIPVKDTQFKLGHWSWGSVAGEVCTHEDFPNQINVEFVHVAGQHEIEIRIFERGVGPTSSSGTGNSAAATAAIALGLAKSPLRVVAPGGAQTVAWDGPGAELLLTGPAALIARGEAWYK
jgi:diaminopimelate epimerase